MKRFRVLWRIILPLLPLVALGALWVRSYRTADVLAMLLGPSRLQCIASHRGRIILFFSSIDFGPKRAWSARIESAPPEQLDPARDWVFGGGGTRKSGKAGFRIASGSNGSIGVTGASYVAFSIPHALPTAVAALWPITRARRAWRIHRRCKAGRCVACGYDLRHSPARCPECGREVEL